jgi:hypothetical protein
MSDRAPYPTFHSHVFLGEGHEKSERKTWLVIWLCTAMMIASRIASGVGWMPDRDTARASRR